MKTCKKLILVVLVAVFATGCGSSGGGDGGASYDGPYNSSGYPAVAGEYSFTTAAMKWECSDGYSATEDAIAFNATIVQSVNELEMTDTSIGSTPGVTIIEASASTGIIETDGAFIMRGGGILALDGIAGEITATSNLDGQFTASEWSGDYKIIYYFQELGTSCNVTTTFTGSKL